MVTVARTEPQKNGAAPPEVVGAKKKIASPRIAKTPRKTKASSPRAKSSKTTTAKIAKPSIRKASAPKSGIRKASAPKPGIRKASAQKPKVQKARVQKATIQKARVQKTRAPKNTRTAKATSKQMLARAAIAIGGGSARDFAKTCQGWARQIKKAKTLDEPGRNYLDLFVKMIDWLDAQEAAARQFEEIRKAGPRLAPKPSHTA